LAAAALGTLVLGAGAAGADEAATHYNMALQLKRQGKTAEAITEVKKAIRARPKYAAAFFTLGNLERAQANYDGAVKAYTESLNLEPANPQTRANLGAAYVRLGRLDEGIVELEKVEPQKFEGRYEALLSLGVALRKKGHHERAAAVLVEATKENPKDAQAWTNLGVARARTEDKEGAVVAFKKAIEIEPQNGEFHFNLGTAHRRLRQTPEAIAAYEKAVELDPGQAGAYYDLGVLHSQGKSHDKALAAFRGYLKAGAKLSAKDRKDAEERIKSLEAAAK
jgi:superkiller protein 3